MVEVDFFIFIFWDKIENLIAKLGIGSSGTLAGRRKDIPNMLAAMDIFFYPSVYEGLPNALIEAMACSLPLVASNIPEIVADAKPTICAAMNVSP